MECAQQGQGHSDACVYTLFSDGEIDEGAAWEALMSAAHWKLSNLIAIVDVNNVQADGASSQVMGFEPLVAKMEAFGWHTRRVDSNDIAAVAAAFDQARSHWGECPRMIICDTRMGRGVPFLEAREREEPFHSHRTARVALALDALVNHRTYAFVGDGCLQEGIGQEMIALAGHLRLAKLTLLWDDNRISDNGSTELSIGIGKNGPTHQPVEVLASLRVIPNIWVMRPADATEAAKCWELALERRDGPVSLVFARQALPRARLEHAAENLSRRGAYVLARERGGPRRITLLATGSEVTIALATRAALQSEGIPTAVVSMPCCEPFERQDAATRTEVLGPGTVRVAVEAVVRLGWDRWLGNDGAFVGMAGFGASGPADALYEHFGISAANVAAQAPRRRLAERGRGDARSG